MMKLDDILREKILPELVSNVKRVKLEIELKNGFIESIELSGKLNNSVEAKE